jgi:hypothetical protein
MLLAQVLVPGIYGTGGVELKVQDGVIQNLCSEVKRVRIPRCYGS